MTATVHKLPVPDGLQVYEDRIHKLMDNWTENAIDIGVTLLAAQQKFTRERDRSGRMSYVGWAKWAQETTGLSDAYVRNLTAIAKRFGRDTSRPKVAVRVLKLLVAKSTPSAARREIERRMKRGDKIQTSHVERAIEKHRPKPAEANKIAKETGKAVLASDGYIYLGADKADVKEATAKRTVIFAIRGAIETLAEVQLSPQQLLDMALPHQLLRLNEGNQIPRAATWLVKFSRAWRRRR